MTAGRVVLFDLGGTLVAAGESPGSRIARGLAGADGRTPGTLAAEIDAIVLRHQFATPEEAAVHLAAELALPREPVTEVREAWDVAARPVVPLDGAATCVAAVRATGTRVAVVANLWTPAALGARAGWAVAFPEVDGWFLSCELGRVKPGAALFQAALAGIGTKPEAALIVGDDLAIDVTPGIALGMSAVWLRRDDEAAEPGVVPVDPHGAPFPIPADVVPAGAVVARSLSDDRRMVLTWLWAARERGSRLTRPLTV